MPSASDLGEIEKAPRSCTEHNQAKERSRKRSHSSPERLSESRELNISQRAGSPGCELDEIDPTQPSWALYHHFPNLIRKISKGTKSKSVKGEIGGWLRSGKKIHDAEEQGNDEEEKWEDQLFRINLAELQRMKLRKLQIKLVNTVVDMRFQRRETEDWEDILSQYVKAEQEYDYTQATGGMANDPFLVTSERGVDKYVLARAMEKYKEQIAQDPLDQIFLKQRFGGGRPYETAPIANSRGEIIRESERRNFKKRVIMAGFGAVFLLAPMWLMVLHHSKYTALCSTTCFVVVFGVVMIRCLEKEMDVLSSTAAYAAVLVVFVGLNT